MREELTPNDPSNAPAPGAPDPASDAPAPGGGSAPEAPAPSTPGGADPGVHPSPDPAPATPPEGARPPLRVETWFSATEAEAAEMTGKVAVVIDVIRATTVIVEALSSGASNICPTVSTEDAIKLANTLGREDTLLCGERKGLKVDGFHLGNSPREFTPEKVKGKRLVMSTTNGTRALWAAQDADRVVVLSFLNLRAVAESVADASSLALVCAGKEGAFSLDDAFCAGLLIRELALVLGESGPGRIVLNDQSRAALALADAFTLDEAFLRQTAAGAALVEVGLGEDLAHCARKNRVPLVPEMRDRVIRLFPPAPATRG